MPDMPPWFPALQSSYRTVLTSGSWRLALPPVTGGPTVVIMHAEVGLPHICLCLPSPMVFYAPVTQLQEENGHNTHTVPWVCYF